MKFEYKFDKNDYAYFLRESNNKYNYMCLALFTFVYFVTSLDLLESNIAAVFVSYFVSILILFTVLQIVKAIFVKIAVSKNDKSLNYAYGNYKVEITKTKIIEDIDSKHVEIPFKNIYRINKNDKYLILFLEDSDFVYLFLKKSFNKKINYEKCCELILSNYAKSKNINIDNIEEKKEVKRNIKKKKKA